mgnify:CR=1 FL=1
MKSVINGETILRTKTNNSFVHTVSFVYVRQPKAVHYTKRRKNKMNRGNKAEYSGNEKWQKFKKEFWGKKLLALQNGD